MGEKIEQPKIPQKIFTFQESRFWQKKSFRDKSELFIHMKDREEGYRLT